MLLHANAVTQDRAAGIRTGRINSNDANRAILFAIKARKLIYQRALPCARSASQADDAGFACIWK
jgi:hypothetical protein